MVPAAWPSTSLGTARHETSSSRGSVSGILDAVRESAPGIHAEAGPEDTDEEGAHHANVSAEPPTERPTHRRTKNAEELRHTGLSCGRLARRRKVRHLRTGC